MAPLAADRITLQKNPTSEQAYLMASATTIYAGAMVMLNGSGLAVPAADAAGGKVVGVAKKTVINPSGGTLKVNAEHGWFKFPATSITQAMVGTKMHVVDDQTFDDAAGVNAVVAGTLMEFVSATEGWIMIEPGMLLPTT